MSNSIQNIYTYKDVARRYEVHIKTVHRWVSAGMIGHLKIGRAVRFTEEILSAFEKTNYLKPIA